MNPLNRFFTVLVIPEKTTQVRRFVIPSWVLKSSAIGFALVVLLSIIMVLDYWFVMNQISENRELKLDNRRLRQQVQVFENKITTIEATMERVKTFTTRLKVITNISDHDNLLQSLNQELPDASTNIGIAQANPSKDSSSLTQKERELTLSDVIRGESASTISPEDLELKRDFERMDGRLGEINKDTLYVEQTLQDQYELLADQRSFLAALPTRRPTIGYFTSGFGVRKSPYGGKIKMHEGLDIANRPGTIIRATADGTVLFAETKAGYGRTVIVDHGYGIETWYGHASRILVKRGQHLQRGDEVALIGSSGRSTGPHLHYEVRVRGIPVNPLDYILEN